MKGTVVTMISFYNTALLIEHGYKLGSYNNQDPHMELVLSMLLI